MFWEQEDFSEVGETVGGRGLKEHPSPRDGGGAFRGGLPTAAVAWRRRLGMAGG